MHEQQSLSRGELAGGKTGDNLRYTLPHIRGDLVRYVSGTESSCHNIGILSQISDQTILQIQDKVPNKLDAPAQTLSVCWNRVDGAHLSLLCGGGFTW